MFLFRNENMNYFRWRKCFLILIVAVCWRLELVNGLKCYCNVDSSSCPNATCETDGYCYASTTLDNGVQKYTYQYGNA
ncbi:unnamed protein product [Leptidea sinapis]|uniref:Activin types I and II receptor domain-containing protein n=1 Tax=Leptidea sinapis TaxID=189913 RepID=A0A5E4QFT0_9NEOP|nr:unnamed protein product [Leptidea sinapis]